MKNEIIFIIEESFEVGFEPKAFGHSIFTEAENLDSLKISIRESVNCHFNEADMHKIIRLHYIIEEVIAA